MAEIQVPEYSNFKIWWEKTNEMGVAIGDFDNFAGNIDPLFGGAANPNLVSAINSVAGSGTERLLLVRAMALS